MKILLGFVSGMFPVTLISVSFIIDFISGAFKKLVSSSTKSWMFLTMLSAMWRNSLVVNFYLLTIANVKFILS